MTGFGRGSAEVAGRRCVVEVRSVNHRFLDLKLRLSPPWADPVIEQLVGQAVRRRVERGSLVVTVREEGVAQGEPVVRVDQELARAYGKALGAIAHALGFPEHQAVPEEALGPLLALVAAQPGVILPGEAGADPEGRFQALEPALDEALRELLACRQREGEALARDLLGRVEELGQHLAEVARLADGAPEAARRRLEERLQRLLGRVGEARRPHGFASAQPWEVPPASPGEGGGALAEPPLIDPARIAQEVALLADRLDVTEEITRLRTHLSEFVRLCNGEALAGRRLDFLTQEINREVNTIASKAQSAEVADRVVAMKAELERLREQIQNVE